MRKIRVLIVVMVLLCITGCSSQEYYAQSDIQADKDTFGVTADECVDLINQDIAGSGLPLIPQQCKQDDIDAAVSYNNEEYEYQYTLYQYEIEDGITMELYSFPEFEEKISTIKIICRSDLKETKKNAEKYFTIICQNIEPGFDVGKFIGDAPFNHNVQVNGKTFYCNTFNETLGTGDMTRIKEYYSTVLEEYQLCY